MPRIELTDEAFRIASTHARASGYESVDAYVSSVVIQDAEIATLFDEETLRELDDIAATVRAGGATHTIDALRDHFDQKR